MHDLDRSLFEGGELGGGSTLAESYSGEQEEFQEVLSGFLGESPDGGGREIDAVTRELELASELLEISSEQELDRFLGSLLSKAVSGVRSFAKTPTGSALGGVLKQAAGQALPIIGKGIGGQFGGAFGERGERVGKAIGGLLGLELEGLSAEDREFEVAKAFVRFAQDAAKQAVRAPAQAPPMAVARAAAAAAAQKHLPGLLPGPGGPAGGARPASGSAHPAGTNRSGRWVRSGHNIVILGA